MKTLIEMAQEAGFLVAAYKSTGHMPAEHELKRFSTLIRQQVIEELAGMGVEPSFIWHEDKDDPDGCEMHTYADSGDVDKSDVFVDGICPNCTRLYPLEAIAAARVQERGRFLTYDKSAMNDFMQKLYDEKMREGKHGHYETLFHCVHEAIRNQGGAV